MPKEHKWRCWTYLTTAILVPVFMFGLDLSAVILGEWVVPLFFILILVGSILSMVFLVVTLMRGQARKLIPITALMITVINLSVGELFILFGAVYSGFI